MAGALGSGPWGRLWRAPWGRAPWGRALGWVAGRAPRGSRRLGAPWVRPSFRALWGRGGWGSGPLGSDRVSSRRLGGGLGSDRFKLGALGSGRLGVRPSYVRWGRLGGRGPWGQTEFQVNLKLGLTPHAGPHTPSPAGADKRKVTGYFQNNLFCRRPAPRRPVNWGVTSAGADSHCFKLQHHSLMR